MRFNEVAVGDLGGANRRRAEPLNRCSFLPNTQRDWFLMQCSVAKRRKKSKFAHERFFVFS